MDSERTEKELRIGRKKLSEQDDEEEGVGGRKLSSRTEQR
jgi:hypothetical protein